MSKTMNNIQKTAMMNFLMEHSEFRRAFYVALKAGVHFHHLENIIVDGSSNPQRIMEAKEATPNALRKRRYAMEGLSREYTKVTGTALFSYWGKGDSFNYELMLADYEGFVPGIYSKIKSDYHP